MCLLKSALYRLHQAERNCYDKLDVILKSTGVMSTNADPCMYRLGGGENLKLLVVDVDDILVATRNDTTVSRIREIIASVYENQLPYREQSGALTYLSVATRSDTSYAVSNFRQFNHCYTRAHCLLGFRGS